MSTVVGLNDAKARKLWSTGLVVFVVLAIMVFPLMVAVTDEVLRNIPKQMRESTLALGATRWETTWCVVRWAKRPRPRGRWTSHR